MLEVILFIALLLPVAWLVSEAQRHRWISVVLGLASMAVVGFAAYALSGFLTVIDLNVSYGEASKSLATAISEELDAGRESHVKRELKRFVAVYHPNYENVPRYDEVVAKAVEGLRKNESGF
jgi:hypothetical protein